MTGYGPSGAFFDNREDKKSDRAPDYSGYVEIDQELINALQRALDEGGEFARLRLAGWCKRGQRMDFISLKPSIEEGRGRDSRSSGHPVARERGPRDEDRRGRSTYSRGRDGSRPYADERDDRRRPDDRGDDRYTRPRLEDRSPRRVEYQGDDDEIPF